jgi:hypothetical protein
MDAPLFENVVTTGTVTDAAPASMEPATTAGADAQVEPDTQRVALETTAEGEDWEAPADSRPEQKSRWARLREKAQRAEKEAAELRVALDGYSAFEPVRDAMQTLVQSLTAESNEVGQLHIDNVEKAWQALADIDTIGAQNLAGYIVDAYGDYYVSRKFNASPEEIEVALRLYKEENGEDGPIAVAPRRAAASDLETRLREEIDGALSPEVAAYLKSQLSLVEQEKARQQQQEADAMAAQQAERLREFNARFDDTFTNVMKEWNVDPQSGLGPTVVREALVSIRENPKDLEIISKAQYDAAMNRRQAALSQVPTINAILSKHIGLVVNRLIGGRQQATVQQVKSTAVGQTPIVGSAGNGVPSVATENATLPLRARLEAIFQGGK